MSIDKRILYSQGQRVAKTMDGSRPGYRGDGEYQGGRGYGGSKSSKGGDKGTGGSKGNIGGGGGGQDSNYRQYSPPTQKTYTSKTIDSKPITGADFRRSRNDFINTLNRNNKIAAAQAGTRFTPYQGGARTTDYYNPNPLKGLLKLAAGFAIPGAGFLINQGGKLKDGLMSLNDKIQNSNFGRSTSLMDYLDMKKYGGYDEREMARRINMDESKNLQARIDAGEFDGLDTMTDEVALTEETTPTLDINEISSLIEAAQRPQSDFEYLGSNFNDGQLMDYQDIGIASDSYNYPDRRQLVNSGTITPLEDDFIGQQPQEGIMGIDVGYPSNDLMATLATNSPALAQQRALQKKQRLSELGGPAFSTDDLNKLNQLNQMDADQNNIYSQTI